MVRILKLNLLEKETEFGFMPTMTAQLIDGNPNNVEKRPAIVIFPGGAYAIVSDTERERIALAYATAGFHTFLVDYCVKPHTHPLPILNAAKAIKLIRENAEEWHVDPDKVAVCGFSAGGHLAGSISTMWNDSSIFSSDEEKNKIHRPDATILCYPVISGGENGHKGSFVNLTGSETENKLWKSYYLENRVDADTPPAFIWHTWKDNGVPVENSLLYASALRKNNIPFELHIYPDGPHGLSAVSDDVYWKLPKFTREYPWLDQSIEWLYLQFGITKIEKEC